MPAPTLVIGVGGTGLRVLLRVKERFVEAYDQVPEDLIILELDTDSYQDATREDFNGTTLLVKNDLDGENQVMANQTEFYQVMTNNKNQMVSTILEKEDAKEHPEWQWVDRVRMTKTIVQPGAESINSGARTVRPIGRAALFLDYSSVYEQLSQRISRLVARIHNEPGKIDNKAQIFVTASVAGGSGAGMVLDVLRMIEHIRKTQKDLPVTVNCMLVGGKCFVREADGQRTLSNTFALLRELDRFGAIAGRMMVKAVPSVMVAPRPVERFRSTIGPADNIYLFDRPDRFGRTRGVDTYGETFLNNVVTASVADIIVGMSDREFTGKFKSLDADLNENMKKGPRGEKGHFPYMSAGIHTLIFPERDVRWSAGFRLLNTIWDEYLVRDESKEKFKSQGSDLPPVSANLWGPEESGLTLDKIIPYIFTEAGFQRDTICSSVANNNFIMTVVRSATAQEISLPSRYPNLLALFSPRTMLQRVWALIGVPSKSHDNYEQLLERAERISERFDASIEELDRNNNKNGIDNWRTTYWGPGTLGAEEVGRGLWVQWLEQDDIIRGHKADFQDVIITVVENILNDKDEAGRMLPYRLEYAQRVLDRLEQLIDVWLYSKDGKKGSRSLLSEYFDSYAQTEADKREKLRSIDPGKDFGKYKRAMQDYARARREMFAQELLKLLCNDLRAVIQGLQKELGEWRTFLRQSSAEIRKRQSKHEGDRAKKLDIPVRTYVTDEGYEKDLYNNYRDKACDMFRKVVCWERDGEGGLYLKNAVFSKFMPELPDNPTQEQLEAWRKAITMTASESATRAINWACTRYGNADRKDEGARPPLRTLASPEEVEMSARIQEFFNTGRAQEMVDTLTAERNITSLCPLKPWPAKRLVFACTVPRYSAKTDVKTFYDNVFTGIRAAAGTTRFNDRTIINEKAENPRHAFAMEIAVGFRLQDRDDYNAYYDTYLKDSAAYNALHCLPEETNASTYFEQAINAKRVPGEKSELYDDLNCERTQLDPVVVDILGNRKRLEQFVKARAVGLIDTMSDGDLYLYPGVSHGSFRLSKMSEIEDKDRILTDLVYDVGRLDMIKQDTKIINRMRLFYALRTFTLMESDLNDPERGIDFVQLEKDINKRLADKDQQKLIENYGILIENYKSFYLEYSSNTTDNLIVLAHLGLVLAKVAFDCRQSVITPQMMGDN